MSQSAIGWSLMGWLFDKQGNGDSAERRTRIDRAHLPATAHAETQAERPTTLADRDAALIAQIHNGDPSAFAALMDAYGDQLANVAYAIVKTNGVAQEIVQDVFFHVWQRRAQLDIRGSVAAYLVRAARNLALNVARRDHVQHRLANDTLVAHQAGDTGVTNTGDDNIAQAEFYAAVTAAIAELQPRRREIFLLHTDQGLRPSEIAQVLGIAPATVHTHIYRATKHLAERLRAWR